MNSETVVIDASPLTIEDVLDVAQKNKGLHLSDDPSFKACIVKGRAALDALWQSDETVYGVTTGVGDSCDRKVPSEMVDQFPIHLSRFHGCGMGTYLSEEVCRAILVVRLASLKSGFSAVRYELLEALVSLVKHDIVPRIPSEGSVGASGDLTPLSYVAAAIMGERDVYYKGEVRPVAQVYEELGLKPFMLKAKEGLAIMNGTAVMTAIACDAYRRASRLLSLGATLTSLLVEALQVNKGHFDLRIFHQKPHPGQLAVARQICEEINYDQNYTLSHTQRVQATYAIRCAPHILGVLADCLPWIRTHIETELNSANDNPLIDPDRGDVLHGGNFYGGHIAFAMDGLKNAVANCCDLMDRQMALLVNERCSNGLPSNLSPSTGDHENINHAFKAVHIATSAWAAESLKHSIPASIFSRSTESHNQDKVSLGTIAARDCIRVLELAEQTIGATLLAGVQALDIRIANGELEFEKLSLSIKKVYQDVRDISPFVNEDRPLESDLRQIVALIHKLGV